MEKVKAVLVKGINLVKCVWHSHRFGRMCQWAGFSAFLYFLALVGVWPLLVQAALTKGANVNAGAFVGYWVDRTLFSYFDAKLDSDPPSISDHAKGVRLLCRALVAAACIIGFSTGIGA